jgi:hypothetical protein
MITLQASAQTDGAESSPSFQRSFSDRGGSEILAAIAASGETNAGEHLRTRVLENLAVQYRLSGVRGGSTTFQLAAAIRGSRSPKFSPSHEIEVDSVR